MISCSMPASIKNYRIERVCWETHEQSLRLVRQKVFIEEQGVLPEEEWDELDSVSQHLLAIDAKGTPVGTARLTPSGKLGRLAVLPEHRGKGLGRMLVESVIELARELGFDSIGADAQVRALEFYRRLGFVPYGEQFLDARIPHRKVKLDLEGNVERKNKE